MSDSWSYWVEKELCMFTYLYSIPDIFSGIGEEQGSGWSGGLKKEGREKTKEYLARLGKKKQSHMTQWQGLWHGCLGKIT